MDNGTEHKRRGERQPDSVVELHGQVRKLQLGGQKILFSLQRLRLAFDSLFFERAAKLHLLYALFL